jgi:hypothetical protein
MNKLGLFFGIYLKELDNGLDMEDRVKRIISTFLHL